MNNGETRIRIERAKRTLRNFYSNLTPIQRGLSTELSKSTSHRVASTDKYYELAVIQIDLLTE